jgi:oxygen-independent coproporphyrinogen-3 oxidase
MAGIYIHIPFCSQACHYCDFHFSTNLKPKTEMLGAIIKELGLRKDYLKNENIESIYFGGGTPSILNKIELKTILSSILDNFAVSNQAEITLEANPEDLSLKKLDELRSCGINRLSIGVQTFHEDTLKFMNRAHNANESELCLSNARSAGFDNISTDLIFAVPPAETTVQRFEKDLKRLIEFSPEHISLYGLTIEPKTIFGHRYAKKEFKPVEEELNAIQYEMAIDQLKAAGYDHYEVSNFGKPNYVSRHNSSYWLSQNYLGIGPGAHSFNGTSRAYNVSNNAQYLKCLKENQLAIEEENLSRLDQINEYVLTRIRTKWGISLNELSRKWGADFGTHQSFFDKLVDENRAVLKDDVLCLTSRGFCLADEISLQLFSTE